MRQLNSCGLKRHYEEDSDFATKMRYLAALAFVPVARVESTFEIIVSSGILPSESQVVIDYFEDTWVGRPQNRSQRRRTTFPIEWWNCYESVLQAAPKTNNAVEGWHRGFETTLDTTHANIFKLLSALQKEQTIMLATYEQAAAGEPAAKRRKYKDAADRLHQLVQTYDVDDMEDDEEVIDYIRGIAHNIGY